MGFQPPLTTLAKTRTSTRAAPPRSKARAAALSVAPEVSTSSTSRIFRPMTAGAARLGHGKGALHIVGALGAVRPICGAVRLTRASAKGSTFLPLASPTTLRQGMRLIELPPQEPAPMQRHGDDEIGLVEKLRPGARHPPAERLRQFRPVAIFERWNQVAHRAILEPRDGAGTMIDGRIGDRLRRLQAGNAEIIGKRRAKPLAIGLLDKADAPPAGGAKCAMRGHRLAAGEARRREDDVERGIGQRPPLPQGFCPNGRQRSGRCKRGLGVGP